MSKPIITVDGVIRGIRPLRHKETHPTKANQLFAHEVSVLTDADGILGETLKILVFRGTHGLVHELVPGARIKWITEIDANQYGLSAVYKTEYGLDLEVREHQAEYLEAADAA